MFKLGDRVRLMRGDYVGVVSEVTDVGFAVRWSTGANTGYFQATELEKVDEA